MNAFESSNPSDCYKYITVTDPETDSVTDTKVDLGTDTHSKVVRVSASRASL